MVYQLYICHHPLQSAKQIFVRVETPRTFFIPPCEGPFLVIQMDPKIVTIKRNGRWEKISVVRVKPAFFLSPAPVAVFVESSNKAKIKDQNPSKKPKDEQLKKRVWISEKPQENMPKRKVQFLGTYRKYFLNTCKWTSVNVFLVKFVLVLIFFYTLIKILLYVSLGLPHPSRGGGSV